MNEYESEWNAFAPDIQGDEALLIIGGHIWWVMNFIGWVHFIQIRSISFENFHMSIYKKHRFMNEINLLFNGMIKCST